MTLRINTNISSLVAHNNMVNNDNALSSSLQKLSSGLRINKAADDASGMAIADSLQSQAAGLGQAVSNANDGISIVQTADGALAESINIVNTIKTKAIQSAQDGQTTESRKAIQADITKLTEELNTIANTTSFNGQKLLSGNFTNKQFQVGAYSGQTVNVSIGATQATKIGQISTTDLTFGGTGQAAINLYSNLQNKTFSLNPVDLEYNNSAENGVGAVADAINKMSDVLGITAQATVASTAAGRVAAGTTDASFAINGVNIGAVTVAAGDSTGALVTAINAKSDQHGVTASVDANGILTLTSNDARAIQVTQDGNTNAVLGGSDLSTLGKISLTQTGTGAIQITDQHAVAGLTVSAAAGSIKVSGMTASKVAFTVTSGSVLASGTIFGSGTVLQGTFTQVGATKTVSGGTIIGAGSVLSSGSQVGSGTVLTGNLTVAAASTTTGPKDSVLTTGTFLSSGTALASGSVFNGDVTAFISGSTAGAVVFRDGQTFVSGGGTADVKAGGLTLTAGATLYSGSIIAKNSIMNSGSSVQGVALQEKGKMTLNSAMTMDSSSTAGKITSGSILTTGTNIKGTSFSGKGTVAGAMTLTADSRIANKSTIENGSTLATAAGAGATGVIDLVDDTIVGPKDMILAKGSTLASGSILKAGTVLSDNTQEASGGLFLKGTTLTRDIITSGTYISKGDMIVAAGSMLKSGTLLGDGFDAKSDDVASTTSNTNSYRLSDINVTTQAGAQIGISVADAALQNLDKVRSDLGSVQNQLTSTIANVSATQVNVQSAESNIRDVDFASESANFSKMQILVQAGSFAMAQSNASGKAVLSLLQG
jgi:flagellin